MSKIAKTLSKRIKDDFKESISLDKLISSVIKSPDFKVNRDTFLREEFKDFPEELIETIIEKGPVNANCSKEELRRRATDLLEKKISSSDSDFQNKSDKETNLPAEIIHFYSTALQSAQEISYLYGETDLWKNKDSDSKEVKNQLMLYCAVMLGATGAAQTVKAFSSSVAKEIKKKALSKIIYYPVVKAASKAMGKDVTLKSLSESVSKKLPAIGDTLSEGITSATLLPMGNRIIDALEKAHFDFSDEESE